MDSPPIEVPNALPATLACPACNGPVSVKSRHVAVAGSAVRVYCSEECLQSPPDDTTGASTTPEEPATPSLWPRALGISIGLGALVLLRGEPFETQLMLPIEAAVAPAAAAPAPRASSAADAPTMAPDELAKKTAQQQEAVWVADLAKDAWFHPLAGPRRWMPQNHTQAFGAERPGERPPECVSGHCGVDLGGGLWGEPVHAAHDGVVDRVNRGPNEEHGGVYVRIAHRDRTVFTWYFHLAAVPRWITPGTRVEAGQIIGLVGDTGVKQSAPHLHFAISVKPSADAPERYLDPESLISLWPLWIPAENGTGLARVSTHEPPGVPMRGKARPKKAAPVPANDESPSPPAAAPEPAAPAPAAPPSTTAAAPSTAAPSQ